VFGDFRVDESFATCKMKRVSTRKKHFSGNSKRRKDEEHFNRKGKQLKIQSESEEERLDTENPQNDSKESDTEELHWKPELIWTSPPKPIPNLDDHPLLRNLPIAEVPPRNSQSFLPPLYPHIPPPTLYLEPLSPISKEKPTETKKASREPEAKPDLNTPTSSQPISPHSCPSSGSAAKPELPSQCHHTSPNKGKRKEAPTAAVVPDRPGCTLHYYRQVRNAPPEGFIVLQGQIWHGQSLAEEGEGEGQTRRRWRRHQWMVDG
jgi:hypothetical protein